MDYIVCNLENIKVASCSLVMVSVEGATKTWLQVFVSCHRRIFEISITKSIAVDLVTAFFQLSILHIWIHRNIKISDGWIIGQLNSFAWADVKLDVNVLPDNTASLPFLLWKRVFASVFKLKTISASEWYENLLWKCQKQSRFSVIER